MPRFWILDANKALVPVDDVLVWAQYFETADRIVAVTERDGVRVSTVFLGIDHNFSDEGDPSLFETMVFGGAFDSEEERYATWIEAEAGHREMVERVFA